MKLKCIMCDRRSVTFTEGALYEAKPSDFYKDEFVVTNDYGNRDTVPLDGALWKFEIVKELELTEDEHYAPYFDEPMSPQRTKDAVQVAAIRSIQEQCSKVNLSISIDPSGFNVFDCDNDLQVMVHSVADVLEILESKLKFKSDMEKYQWM